MLVLVNWVRLMLCCVKSVLFVVIMWILCVRVVWMLFFVVLLFLLISLINIFRFVFCVIWIGLLNYLKFDILIFWLWFWVWVLMVVMVILCLVLWLICVLCLLRSCIIDVLIVLRFVMLIFNVFVMWRII